MNTELDTWCGWLRNSEMLEVMISESRGIELQDWDHVFTGYDDGTFGIGESVFTHMWISIEDDVWVNIWFMRGSGEIVDAGRRTKMVFHEIVRFFNLRMLTEEEIDWKCKADRARCRKDIS